MAKRMARSIARRARHRPGRAGPGRRQDAVVTRGRSIANLPCSVAVRAVVCHEFAPIDQLVVEERPDPEPGPGQGGGRRAGGGRELRRRAVRPGQVPDQAAAAVHAGRRGGRRRGGGRRGRRRAWRSATACWPCRGWAGSPPTSSWRPAASSRSRARSSYGQAAALVQSYGTMLFSFTRRMQLQRRASGCSCSAPAAASGWPPIDVARHLGARVIAAASSEDKLAAARAAGAEATIAYETEDLKVRARELSGGGVDVVVDPGRRPLRRPGAAGARLDGPLPRDRVRRRRDPAPARSTRCCSTTAPWSASTGARGRCATRPATRPCSAELMELAGSGALHPVEPHRVPARRRRAARSPTSRTARWPARSCSSPEAPASRGTTRCRCSSSVTKAKRSCS